MAMNNLEYNTVSASSRPRRALALQLLHEPPPRETGPARGGRQGDRARRHPLQRRGVRLLPSDLSPAVPEQQEGGQGRLFPTFLRIRHEMRQTPSFSRKCF